MKAQETIRSCDGIWKRREEKETKSSRVCGKLQEEKGTKECQTALVNCARQSQIEVCLSSPTFSLWVRKIDLLDSLRRPHLDLKYLQFTVSPYAKSDPLGLKC
jgi:hypothetical protein